MTLFLMFLKQIQFESESQHSVMQTETNFRDEKRVTSALSLLQRRRGSGQSDQRVKRRNKKNLNERRRNSAPLGGVDKAVLYIKMQLCER